MMQIIANSRQFHKLRDNYRIIIAINDISRGCCKVLTLCGYVDNELSSQLQRFYIKSPMRKERVFISLPLTPLKYPLYITETGELEALQ